MNIKLIGLMCCFVLLAQVAMAEEQQTDSNEVAKNVPMATDEQVLNSIKKKIKPVEIKEGAANNDISIQYEIPRKELNTSLGDAGAGSFLDMKVQKNQPELSTSSDYTIVAYSAAMASQLEASAAMYKKAIEKEPSNVSLLYSLGSVYQKLGQVNDAKNMYKKVLKIQPDHKNAMSNYIVLMAEQNPDMAIGELQQLEKTNPNFSPVLAQIGMLYAKKGQLDMAEAYLARAITVDPAVINYRYNLAVVYDKKGKYSAALKMYREILLSSENLPVDRNYLRSRVNHLQEKLANM